MPAHSGVWLYEYPCRGNQMPCSQMMSTNCRPPRATATANAAMLPAVKARIRKRLSWNSGSATLRLDHHERAQQGGAADEEASTTGLVQPRAWWP